MPIMEIHTNFWWLLNFLFLTCTLRVHGQHGDPRVTTSSGVVVGSLVHVNDVLSNRQIEVKQFLGIPFAEKPIGDLRFRKPRNIRFWNKPLQCKDMPKACVQYMETPYPWRMSPDDPNISEDCLYLNIWVPRNASPRNKKSVFFWIYGGGFFMGSNRQEIYDGRAIAALGDVIVVTTNYRLGSLGFWSNNGHTAPGNVGIWDVIHALKWVHNDIENFGGEKNNITIAGESAGSVIVSLLTITEFARGLYKRQIMQSASALWLAMEDEQATIKRSFAVAEKVGCANESFKLGDHPAAIETCMRGIDALTIIKKEAELNPGAANSFLPRWGEALFPRNPRKVLLEGGFQFQELFIGNSGMEGVFKVPTQNPDLFGFFGKKDVLITREEGRALLEKIRPTFFDKHQFLDYYFPSENDANTGSREYEIAIADALGDYGLTCPTVNYAAVSVQSGKKVYYYDFQHRPKNSPWADWMGTTHFDEVDFVFGGPFKFIGRYESEERVLSQKMISHWTNFVKYGKPRRDWPLYGEKFEMMVYTNGDPTLGHGPRTNSCRLWQPYFDPDDKLELLLSY